MVRYWAVESRLRKSLTRSNIRRYCGDTVDDATDRDSTITGSQVSDESAGYK